MADSGRWHSAWRETGLLTGETRDGRTPVVRVTGGRRGRKGSAGVARSRVTVMAADEGTSKIMRWNEERDA